MISIRQTRIPITPCCIDDERYSASSHDASPINLFVYCIQTGKTDVMMAGPRRGRVMPPKLPDQWTSPSRTKKQDRTASEAHPYWFGQVRLLKPWNGLIAGPSPKILVSRAVGRPKHGHSPIPQATRLFGATSLPRCTDAIPNPNWIHLAQSLILSCVTGHLREVFCAASFAEVRPQSAPGNP